ncbi:MAG: 30S ribosomal protein S17 [Candidatus Woesearchaeota archaeon]|nr:MAG: 30S ribosomal protein S17 [Candidatus Woesearchaeota archaeon]
MKKLTAKESTKPSGNASKHDAQEIGTRGRVFSGVVTSAKMHRTVVVSWDRRKYDKKYERYEKRTTRVKAHVPEGMTVAVGATVTIAETRPISKTKHFIVTEVKE